MGQQPLSSQSTNLNETVERQFHTNYFQGLGISNQRQIKFLRSIVYDKFKDFELETGNLAAFLLRNTSYPLYQIAASLTGGFPRAHPLAIRSSSCAARRAVMILATVEMHCQYQSQNQI